MEHAATRAHPRILVVEDAETAQLLLATTLATEDWDAEIVSSAEAGFISTGRHLPDLIILDIELPGMNGWQMLRRLRDEPATSDIPVIVVTAHDVGEKATQRNFPDADAFVGKPFDIAALRRLVRKHLDLALSKAS